MTSINLTSKSEPAIVVISAGNIIAEPFCCGKKPLTINGNIEYLSSVGQFVII